MPALIAMTQRYIELQKQLIERYKIQICDGSLCRSDWCRTHAHVAERRVCKWEAKNSVQSTFTLLHEIGHIQTSKSRMRRCESEYFATVWALITAKECGMEVPAKLIDRYQKYIFIEYERGMRRGGKLPHPRELLLPRF